MAELSNDPRFAALAAIPANYGQPDPSTLAKLPKPMKKDAEKGRCDVCGGYHGLPAIHLDYMGHAEITLALIEIDPFWNWEPLAIDSDAGGPVIQVQGNRLVMWAKLTVLGKSIIGVGTCEAGKGDPEKELIGDFLRNAAMRFGVATKLWSKATDADPAGTGSAGFSRQRKSDPKPVDPERIEATKVFNAIRALGADDKATFSAWMNSLPAGHPKLSGDAMTENALWRAEVKAKVEEITSGFVADDPNDPLEPVQTELAGVS